MAVRATVTRTVSAQNQFSNGTTFGVGQFNVSVQGTFVATVWLQRSYDGGSTWYDVKSYTAVAEEVADNPEESVRWRIGVKTGGFGSGSPILRLSQ